MRCTVSIALATLFAAVAPAEAQKPAKSSATVVYNFVGTGAGGFDREAKAAYAGKFKFVDVTEADGYEHPRKHPPLYFYRDPRRGGNYGLEGNVVIACILSPRGYVIEPRVLRSTNKRLEGELLTAISRDTYVPAKMKGVAVHSLLAGEVRIRSERRPDGGSGLGVK